MGQNCESNSRLFTEYLKSMSRLDSIEGIAEDLNIELAESQRTMKDIKSMLESISTTQAMTASQIHVDSGLRQEDLSSFLEADMPTLLLPDMAANNLEVDLDDIIASMKGYAENLQKNIKQSRPQTPMLRNDMEKLDIEHDALSLDQLSKRLSNIRLTKQDEMNERNGELETKLTQLCQDVELLTKMVYANNTLSEQNGKLTESHPDEASVHYDDIVNKLLSGINEVTYLMIQNKN